MEVDILYFKTTDKVIVFHNKVEFVNGKTFPHVSTNNGVRYSLKKYEYNKENYLIGCNAPTAKDEIEAAIEEFKPNPLY